MGCHSLLQGNLPNPGIEPESCKQIPYRLRQQESQALGKGLYVRVPRGHQKNMEETSQDKDLHIRGQWTLPEHLLGCQLPEGDEDEAGNTQGLHSARSFWQVLDADQLSLLCSSEGNQGHGYWKEDRFHSFHKFTLKEASFFCRKTQGGAEQSGRWDPRISEPGIRGEATPERKAGHSRPEAAPRPGCTAPGEPEKSADADNRGAAHAGCRNQAAQKSLGVFSTNQQGKFRLGESRRTQNSVNIWSLSVVVFVLKKYKKESIKPCLKTNTWSLLICFRQGLAASGEKDHLCLH